MRLMEGILFDQLGDEHAMIIPDGNPGGFHGMIKLNSSGWFIAQQLKEEITEEFLVRALLEQYSIEKDYAKSEVRKIVDKFREIGILLSDD